MFSRISAFRKSKLLKKCDLPLTGVQCVQHILTDLGWFDVVSDDANNKSLILTEIAPDISIEEIRQRTDAEFAIAENLKTISV